MIFNHPHLPASLTNLVDEQSSARNNLLLKLQLLSQLIFGNNQTLIKQSKFDQAIKLWSINYLGENLLEQKYWVAVLAKSNLGNISSICWMDMTDVRHRQIGHHLNHVLDISPYLAHSPTEKKMWQSHQKRVTSSQESHQISEVRQKVTIKDSTLETDAMKTYYVTRGEISWSHLGEELRPHLNSKIRIRRQPY